MKSFTFGIRLLSIRSFKVLRIGTSIKDCRLLESKSKPIIENSCRFLGITTNFHEDIPHKSDRSFSNNENMKRKEFSRTIRENIWTIPNALSLTRIILAPFIGYLIVVRAFCPALGIFIFAGITDMLDGFIARKYLSQQSLMGSLLDPVADKMLISTLFLSLTYVHLIPLPLTLLILCRDISLIGSGMFLRYNTLESPKTLIRFFDISVSSIRIKPTNISKFNTGMQLFLAAVSLSSPVFGFVDHSLLKALWITTGTTTLYSGLDYIWSKNSAMQAITKNKL